MSSSTPNDAASQSLTTYIVLEWDETSPNGERRRYLTAPDPSDAKIFFKSDISAADGVFMRLHIPVKLKNVPARTPLHVHIRPSLVQSCTFAGAVDAPEAVRVVSQRQLASLSMKLSGPVQIVVPNTMELSSRPARNRASGQVLDAIRSLRRATQLVMYMPADLAPRTHLQRLSALLTGGGLQELPPYSELFKLFGGSGGRIWDVEPLYPTTSPPPDGGGKGGGEGDCDIPPPYHEACVGPSAPPASRSHPETRNRKRRRNSNSSVAVATTGELTRAKNPALRASPPRPPLPEKGQVPELSVLQRLALLEALVHAQAVQISNLSTENQGQRKRIDEYETDLAALRLEIGRVDRQMDRLDLEVSEQREDIKCLEGDVQHCLGREDDIVEAVIDTVTGQISERGLSAANIHFTLGEG